MQQTPWHADPLVWGHGPHVFEVFLEPTCPFSVKALGKLSGLLSQTGEDRVTVKIRLQSQPWLCILRRHRALHSGSLNARGRQGSRKIRLDGCRRPPGRIRVRAPLPRLEPQCHPNDIIARIEDYSGLKLADAFAIPDLDHEIKGHCKYTRQNGIHVSPTFMIDGLVRTDMSSGDAVSDWVSPLLKN